MQDLPTGSLRTDKHVIMQQPAFRNTENDNNLYSDRISFDSQRQYLILDASELGDLPARYVIAPVGSHQFPVLGVYIDKRVITGFKYRVRPLPCVQDNLPDTRRNHRECCLFGNRALTLESIGRGYSRRFTFEADKGCLNNNNNYFWSDNHPGGYAFELEVISEGDKFTLFDVNGEAQGTVEVVKIEVPQFEIGMKVEKESVEKRVSVKFTGKVESFETGVAKPMLVSGVAVCIKTKKSKSAKIIRMINVNIHHHRYYMLPGMQNIYRRVTVRGESINDVPTKYTMTGLQPYEIPVVGTYVDPRIIPGFHYKVRPNDQKDLLFGGRALKLNSIGMGYAKKLSFQPDSLLNPNNYLWSDNHRDGLGLEPRAVHIGMKFEIHADTNILGEASVFRADLPQREERMERLETAKGIAVEKYIHVDVMCHIKLARSGSIDKEEHLVQVYGLAVVRKDPKINDSYVVRVENVGLDSHLNLIFARNHSEVTFIPKP
ncbi:PREDICTED: uncharacterized protein LOC108568361 isoform X2 [Nicrophorus vespilloides]|uniref:Uncharacterized protein LOC108568361 isoform X2 n=1 Tax=Nicrophorus vespilloides TaxID=110193 RepID=A0ABM1NDJ3_NICVS|nr:PREDICTED: uncharacterized protein LOC108568361 isoform X2 [Nicrophorus vespilloides]